MSDKPTVIDVRKNKWQFSYQGHAIQKSLTRKITQLEEEMGNLLTQIERELGTNTKEITTLMVALYATNKSVKVSYIESMCKRYIELEKERAKCARFVKSLIPAAFYVMTEQEIAEVGL